MRSSFAGESEWLTANTFGDVSAHQHGEPELDFGEVSHMGTAFYNYEPENGSTSITVEVIRKVKKKTDSK